MPDEAPGNGKAFAGHGGIASNFPTTIVPSGTTVTIPIKQNTSLWSLAGPVIETGNAEGGMKAQSWWEETSSLNGAVTYLPGAEMPNCTYILLI